jgi:hypothetical protein
MDSFAVVSRHMIAAAAAAAATVTVTVTVTVTLTIKHLVDASCV